MISSRSERMNGHIGTETRPRLLRGGSSGESSAMDESLTEQRRVSDDGLRVVKLCSIGTNGSCANSARDLTVPE